MNFLKILKNKKGFSLVEMAAALAVLGIISGVVYLSTTDTILYSNSTAAGQQLEALRGAVTTYWAKNNYYYPCLTACGNLNGWDQLQNQLPSGPAQELGVDGGLWNITCVNGTRLDILYKSDNSFFNEAYASFQKQCAWLITTAGTSTTTITCRLSAAPRCK